MNYCTDSPTTPRKAPAIANANRPKHGCPRCSSCNGLSRSCPSNDRSSYRRVSHMGLPHWGLCHDTSPCRTCYEVSFSSFQYHPGAWSYSTHLSIFRRERSASAIETKHVHGLLLPTSPVLLNKQLREASGSLPSSGLDGSAQRRPTPSALDHALIRRNNASRLARHECDLVRLPAQLALSPFLPGAPNLAQPQRGCWARERHARATKMRVALALDCWEYNALGNSSERRCN